MNTIIIEKDEFYKAQLETFVFHHPQLFLIGSFNSVLAAYHIFKDYRIDLILLNINTQIPNNLDITSGVQKKPMLIFFHTHPENKINVFNVSIIDLLPLNSNNDALNNAIIKANTEFESRNTEGAKFFVNNFSNVVGINELDIVYIKSMQNYVQIVTTEETYTQLIPLKSIYAQLSPEKFIQIHRSFIINMSKIKQINKDSILVHNIVLPLGNNYKAKFLELQERYNTIIKKHNIPKNSK